MLCDLLYRLRALVRRKAVEREMDAELRFHFERQVEKYVAAGMARAEAQRRARMEFGRAESVKEECREARGVMLIETILQDCRYALRMMHRYPAFTAMAIVLVGLGVGASTSMFSLVAASVLRRPQFSDRLIYIWRFEKRAGEMRERLPQDVLEIGDQARSIERFAAYRAEWFIIDGPRGPERVYGYSVAKDWFRALDVTPARGREFLPEEEQRGRGDVVILTDALWRRLFHADPSALGSRITVQGRSFTVVGILPATFDFDRTELFTPLMPDDKTHDAVISAIANLGRGIDLARAQSEVDSIAAGLKRRDPERWRDWDIRLVTPEMRLPWECGPTCEQAHRGIWLLFGAVGMILLMACANVANLLLARSVGRRREYLIRAAIGCSNGRLVRQNLTETLLLFCCGGTLGVLIAWWSKGLLAKIAGAYLETADIQLDGCVFAFSVAATLATGLLFGLIPAVRSAKALGRGGLQEVGGFSAVPIRRNLSRRLLVSAEFTLALVLLIGFGLLLRSFLYVESIPVGFPVDRLLTKDINLSAPKFKEPAKRISFARAVLERVREMPGVESAGLTSALPLTGADSTNIEIEGIPSADPRGTEVRFIAVSADLLSTLGIPLVEGRTLSPHDTETSALVVVINRTMARMFFPNGSAVGRRIRTEDKSGWREIVGVVEDVRQRNLEEDSRPVFYQPYLQGLDEDLSVAVRARSEADMNQVAASLRKAVREVDPQQPWGKLKSMRQKIYDSESLSLRRPVVRLLGSFGLLGAILATLGLYAVLSYSVSERTREIGIRMALGARRSQVLRQITLDTLRLIAPGAVAGVAAAYGLSSLLPTGHIGWSGSGVFLYGVSRGDAVTYISVAAVLGCIAILAALTPARRAISIDPAGALRHE
jgi:predicted permease